MRVMVVLSLLATLAGCTQRLEIAGNGQGDIRSATGSRDCSGEQGVCDHLIVGTYEETYTATARAGSIFAGWEGLVCDQNPTEPCTYSLDAGFIRQLWGQTWTLRAVFYNADDADAVVTVAGNISYDRVPHNTLTNGLDYAAIEQRPARLIEVEAVDASGNTIAKTRTDTSGRYSLRVPPSTELQIKALARLSAPAGTSGSVEVRDNTRNNSLYVAAGAMRDSGQQNSIRHLHLESGWTGAEYGATRSAAPFAIMDSLYKGMRGIAGIDPAVDFGDLQVFWSPRNTTAEGSLPDGQIGSSFYFENEIYVLGDSDNNTDEYDEHLILHEWGHYFEEQFSRADSQGGSHGAGDYLDMRVAFSEGLSTALAGIILEDPVFRDALGNGQRSGFEINIQDNAALNPGWFSEDSVQAIIFDLYDADADDEVSLGFKPLYQALRTTMRNTPAVTSIFPFMVAVKQLSPDNVPAIDSLLALHSISANVSEFADDETNNAGVANVLPIFTLLNGTATWNRCVINRFNTARDDFNKLSNSRFFKVVPLDGPGRYRFEVSRTSGDNSDPDIRLLNKGMDVGIGVSDVANRETLVATLDDSVHVLELVDFNGGNVCFDVSMAKQ